MEDKIKKLIASEDKKNPYTDERIAEMCHISREDVTVIRQMHHIPDSRERRRILLVPEVQEILSIHGNISDRRLTVMLQERGYQISRFIAKSVKDEVSTTVESPRMEIKVDPNKNFEELIGFDGSMKCQISQAQAAVLYPPKGIHTLIHGPSGVGKSQLAEAMYHFAVNAGALKSGSPFIIFNCADYAENSELLLSQLFGYVKGAFTGAESEKSGLVEKADGGILFLDEVHRLSSEGQEMLFYLIDKGLYRKLGETESTRKAQLLIIAATTEDLDSYLLTTFRRRIPMLIDLPPLSERPLSERFMIIKKFIREEALRINKGIILDKETLKLLLSYPCPGNIGQLRSDIQVSCAKSFLRFITKGENQLIVSLEDLPSHILNYSDNSRNQYIQKFCESDLIVTNQKQKKVSSDISPTIYQVIEEKYDDLIHQGIQEHEIYGILEGELDHELDSLFEQMKYQHYDRKNLEEVVGLRIITTVQRSIDTALRTITDLSQSIISPLCLHISASYERLKQGKGIMNPQLGKIKRDYPLEFKVAKQMSLQYYQDLKIELPDDEVAFIAMYLKTFTKKQEQRVGRIGIVVLTHGNVGVEMIAVANQLLNVNFAVGIRCALDEPPVNAMEKTQRVIEQIDEGKGCLILTDMGSLVTFGQIISEKTGIDIRTISRVDTVMVIEAIRRVMLEDITLDELEVALNQEKEINFHGSMDLEDKEPVLVSACLTGKGSAVMIQSRIQKVLQEHKISLRVLTIGVMSENGIEFELDHISRSYRILAILGNFAVSYREVPFLSTTELLNGNAIPRLMNIITAQAEKENPYNKLFELLNKDLILCQVDEILYKNDILEQLVELLVQHEYVSSEYLLDVYKREAMGATIMGGVAIPHGFTEHVTKPAIAVLTLKEPILWEDDFETNIILMPALKEESIEYTYDLFAVCTNTTVIKALSLCETPDEIIQIISRTTKPSI